MQTVADHPTIWFQLLSSKHCCKKKKKIPSTKKKKHLFSLKIFRVTEPKKINRHYSDEQKRCSAVVHRVITPHHGDKLSPLTQPRARRINFMSKAGPSILCSVARCAKRIRRTNLQFPFRKHTAWGVVVLKCGGESPRMAGQGFRGGDEENTVFFSKLVMESHVTREVAHPLKPAVVHGPVLSTCTVS